MQTWWPKHPQCLCALAAVERVEDMAVAKSRCVLKPIFKEEVVLSSGSFECVLNPES